jgi:hypothetical protein
MLVPKLTDRVKTNISDIVIPTEVGIQPMLAGYGDPRFRGDDTSPDILLTLRAEEQDEHESRGSDYDFRIHVCAHK